MPAALRPTASGNASAPTFPHASPLLAFPPIPLLPSSSVTSLAAPLSAPNFPNSKTNPPPMLLRTSSPHHAPFLSHLTDERTRRRTRESARPPLLPAPSARRLTTLLTNVRLAPSPWTLSVLPPLCPSLFPLPRAPLHFGTPQRSPLPPQLSTWTTSVPCVAMLAISASTAQETSRPGRVATPATKLGISLPPAPKTATAGTATPGDTAVMPAPTPTASVKKIATAQSQPVTLTTGALAPLYRTTPGQTTMDSTTHTTTLTGRHRTIPLECEAGKLHLKKGVML